MKRTKSKLNLVELQKQFDSLLDDFNSNDIITWKVRDMDVHAKLLFSGETIEITSNPYERYEPISCSLEKNNIYNSSNEITYETAA